MARFVVVTVVVMWVVVVVMVVFVGEVLECLGRPVRCIVSPILSRKVGLGLKMTVKDVRAASSDATVEVLSEMVPRQQQLLQPLPQPMQQSR